jgi:hypothetical protein
VRRATARSTHAAALRIRRLEARHAVDVGVERGAPAPWCSSLRFPSSRFSSVCSSGVQAG